MKIEIKYWSNKSNGLCFIDESFYSEEKLYNLLYLRQCFNYPDYINVACPFYLSAVKLFNEYFRNEKDKTLKDLIVKVAKAIDTHAFHAECIFKHMAYQGSTSVDLTQKIELWLPLPFEVKVNPYAY